MMKYVVCLFVFLTVVFACQYNSRNAKKLELPSRSELNIPKPQFNIPAEALKSKIAKKFDAERIAIEEAYVYSSTTDVKYWLKLTLLNPRQGDKRFEEFAKEAANFTLNHVVNYMEFSRLEVRVVRKKGVGLTFTSSENVFIEIDSLLRSNKEKSVK